MNSAAVWTSTQFQNWKTDCTKYMATQQSFEVRDVYRSGDEDYCVSHCQAHSYTCVMQKHTAVCSPPAAH